MSFLKEEKTNWKYILIVVILAAVVGGMILGYLWWTEKEVGPQEIKTSEGVDNRLLLTEKNAEEIWEKECYPAAPEVPDICSDFNYDSPTTEFLYINKEKGISLKIPYNPNWGTKGFKILPYWGGNYEGRYEGGYDYEDKIEFGPLSNCFSRAYCRICSLSFVLPRSLEEIVNGSGSVPYIGKVNKETVIEEEINGHTVISYEVIGGNYCGDIEDSGNCNLSVMEVIGKKYNYIFTPTTAVLFEGDKFEEGKINFSCDEDVTRIIGVKDMRRDITKTIQFIE